MMTQDMRVIKDALDWSMQIGDSIRIKECPQCLGRGNSMAVQITRTETGFMAYCFRCHRTYFVDSTAASPRQARQLTAALAAQDKDTRPEVVDLPADFVTDLPVGALAQLYTSRIEDEHLEVFNIGWSEHHGRIIVPLYKYGRHGKDVARKLVGWAGRKVDKESPSDKPKWSIRRQRSVKHPLFVAPSDNADQVVLVEDTFSAIRVWSATNDKVMAVALLTTYLPYTLYPRLAAGKYQVSIWLDCDAYDKALKYQFKLGQFGVTSRVIHTSQDPKAYSNEEIRNHVRINS